MAFEGALVDTFTSEHPEGAWLNIAGTPEASTATCITSKQLNNLAEAYLKGQGDTGNSVRSRAE